MAMDFATVEATPNIALVKYWGKRNEELVLPVSGSISATMSFELKTRTSIAFSDKISSDEVYVNGEKITGEHLLGAGKCLDFIRKAANVRNGKKARIASINCFPTAAGLASSASGYAALACAANAALNAGLKGEQLSIAARLGSGSASRSVYGGFAEWLAGKKNDGSDSYAVQIKDEKHWPEFRNVIGIIGKEKKKVSSRAGMKETVKTSAYYKEWMARHDSVLDTARKAILSKDLSKLLATIMKESDDMHHSMADTTPPIIYMNELSHSVVKKIREFNDSLGSIEAGYTFDAGPNPHVYTVQKHAKAIEKILLEVDGMQDVITCSVGSGPRVLKDKKESLLDENGNAKKCSYDEIKRKIIIE
ncbi:Diphosphomevalonate decarboxylase [Candidatus Gugararchaeum adminiculabundum]|nr:Diphosphomevalonate decarboxylase [Candidatus Gugararchaeum adminiculabundum]